MAMGACFLVYQTMLHLFTKWGYKGINQNPLWKPHRVIPYFKCLDKRIEMMFLRFLSQPYGSLLKITDCITLTVCPSSMFTI